MLFSVRRFDLQLFLTLCKTVGAEYIPEHLAHKSNVFILTGISDQAKQMITNSNPTVEISQNGDTWNFITTMGEKSRDIKFKLGEEFENNALNGETVKSTITLEGDTMVEKFDWRGKGVKITRKIVDGKLVSKFDVEGDTASITFTKA